MSDVIRRMRPRSLRAWLLTGFAGIIVAAVVVFAVVYFVALRGSSSAPLTLTSPASGSPGASVSATDLAGTWTVGSGSVAGYRVREKLAFLPALSDAVGRTSSVSGNVVVSKTSDGYSVTTGSLTVDVSTLTSDREMRDRRIHRMGLESDTYPTATFTLTKPVVISTAAAEGQRAKLNATGDLTIHGSTRNVTIPITVQRNGNRIEAAGSISFPFAEFGMTPPSIGGFVTVQDNATMEFDLHLQHQS